MSDRCGVTLPEGGKAAHCTVCHETFTTPGNFDRHRKGGENDRACLPPRQIGLMPVERVGYTAWAALGPSDGALFGS